MVKWVETLIQSNLDLTAKSIKTRPNRSKTKHTNIFSKKYYFQEANIIAKALVITRAVTIFSIFAKSPFSCLIYTQYTDNTDSIKNNRAKTFVSICHVCLCFKILSLPLFINFLARSTTIVLSNSAQEERPRLNAVLHLS